MYNKPSRSEEPSHNIVLPWLTNGTPSTFWVTTGSDGVEGVDGWSALELAAELLDGVDGLIALELDS